MPPLAAVRAALAALPPWTVSGRVAAIGATWATVRGLDGLARLGDWATVGDAGVGAEVIGLGADGTRIAPCGSFAGVAVGAIARLGAGARRLAAGPAWLGRVIDPHGKALDGGPAPIPDGPARPLDADPPPAFERRPLGDRMGTGVRVLDLFAPLCRGQRLGLFAGSGVGKSTLVAQLARGAQADAVVLALVGERGREVGQFLTRDLPPPLRARTLTVVATSDQPALLRRDAARAALAAAEALRDRGMHVLLLFDSLTRFALAERDLALAAGELPASRGTPASVFASLARLVERAGPGAPGQGDITALFAVLVEGGDHDEPIADAARGLLDGHVVLDRGIAEAGRFPAVDVLRSVSRALPGAHAAGELAIMLRARRLLAAHADLAELIRLGAYRGGDPLVDEAVAKLPAIEAVLAQRPDDASTPDEAFAALARALEGA